MFAIRAPLATLGGTVFSVALFLGLANLVSVPFEVTERTVANPIVFKTPRPDTPAQNIRDPQIVREPPSVRPELPRIGSGDGEKNVVDLVSFKRPDIALAKRGDTGFGGVDTDVIPRIRVKPEYPPSAITRGIEGWVQLRFTVTAIGTVRDAVVVRSEPSMTFDDAALKAIARWRYNPRVVNGEAVERVGLQTVIRFELDQ
jgi:periplasmic protein TonB